MSTSPLRVVSEERHVVEVRKISEGLVEIRQRQEELAAITASIIDLALANPVVAARVRSLSNIATEYAKRIDAATELLLGRIERL